MAKKGLTKGWQSVAAAGLAGVILLMLRCPRQRVPADGQQHAVPVEQGDRRRAVGRAVRYAPPAQPVGRHPADRVGRRRQPVHDDRRRRRRRPLAGGIWRQSVARITGTPPHIRLTARRQSRSRRRRTRSPRSARTRPVARARSARTTASGLVAVGHVLFATEENDWNWNANGPFAGLDGDRVSRPITGRRGPRRRSRSRRRSGT